jgi:hypothetical protein
MIPATHAKAIAYERRFLCGTTLASYSGLVLATLSAETARQIQLGTHALLMIIAHILDKRALSCFPTIPLPAFLLVSPNFG